VGTDNTYFAALGEQLREEQWEIAVAPSIAEARELLKVECVDCLVIEAALADESTVREIKETLDPQIPLMILANDASISEVFLRASSAGADDLLLKFVDFSVIKAQLRNRLQRKQIEAERRKAAEAQTRHSIDIAEARAAKELAAVRSALVIELEHKNAELLAARESALRASQAKSEFLANMSREIHAPLTSIIDQTRSLLDMKLNCEQQAIAREVSDHAGSILAVMNHLPDFSEISDVSQKADTQHTAAATEPGRKFRILLVDDNGTNRKLALCQLDHLGYLADAVTNGREALDTIARVPFDLVLMDCCLPEMDGYEAARQIRQRERAGQHIPIIAMSANSSDEGKYLDAGMDEYISKPVEIENLAAVLERVLRSQGKAASAVSATDANNRTDPTDGAQGPTLDAATMASLRAEKDLLPGLIETASKEVPEQLQQIADAIGRADDETASIAAHNLKGTAAIFGARRMKNCAAALEHAVNSGSTEKALSTLELLRKECDRLLRELESEGARPATRNQRPPVAP
jgi:CheY-like chemotaxis protein/HPt (histidine-containing phosphotransfer) domain-containing protein